LTPDWVDRELWSPVFETSVVGTTGAGDATIAGFLFGLLHGFGPAETLTAACAVGGSSTEAADGTSGIPSWEEIEARLLAGWRRAGATVEKGWALDREAGVWRGPRDAGDD
jgi:sugar/nucleoside kinase (ribokinase family)